MNQQFIDETNQPAHYQNNFFTTWSKHSNKKKIMDIYPSHDAAAETEKPSCSMIDILVVQDEYSAHFFTSYFLIPAELLLSIIVYFDMLLAVHQ